MALAGAALSGCSDDSCGPGGAPDTGMVAAGGGQMLTYGQLKGGLNGDCPAADAPAGVISLTITGAQTDGTGFITLCVSRPDLFANRAQSLALDVPRSIAEIRIVDVTGQAGSCMFAIDATQPASGTATASGLCHNGGDAAGFALLVDGGLALTRTCGAEVTSVAVTLRGRVAVAHQ